MSISRCKASLTQGPVLDNPHWSLLVAPRRVPTWLEASFAQQGWGAYQDPSGVSAVRCHPLSCKRDQEGSKQPTRGQVLCWERTLPRAIPTGALVYLNAPGWGSSRAEGFNTSPALPLEVQSQERLFTTEGTVPPGLSVVPLFQGSGFQGLSQASWGQEGSPLPGTARNCSHRQGPTGRRDA